MIPHFVFFFLGTVARFVYSDDKVTTSNCFWVTAMLITNFVFSCTTHFSRLNLVSLNSSFFFQFNNLKSTFNYRLTTVRGLRRITNGSRRSSEPATLFRVHENKRKSAKLWISFTETSLQWEMKLSSPGWIVLYNTHDIVNREACAGFISKKLMLPRNLCKPFSWTRALVVHLQIKRYHRERKTHWKLNVTLVRARSVCLLDHTISTGIYAPIPLLSRV